MFRNRQCFYIFVSNAVYGNYYIFNSSKNQGLVHAFLTFLWIGSIYGISPRCDFHFNCFVVNATWAMYIEISRILIYLLTFRSLLNPHITNKKFKIWGTKVITFYFVPAMDECYKRSRQVLWSLPKVWLYRHKMGKILMFL